MICLIAGFVACMAGHMMTSSNGNISRVTDHLCGEFTGPRWIPPHKGQWRGALMFSLIYVWINGWVNNPEAGDLRRCRAHYDVIVMWARAKQNKRLISCLYMPRQRHHVSPIYSKSHKICARFCCDLYCYGYGIVVSWYTLSICTYSSATYH